MLRCRNLVQDLLDIRTRRAALTMFAIRGLLKGNMMSTQDTYELGAVGNCELDNELERQEYLDEMQLDSTQFGIGRWHDNAEGFMD